MSSRKREEKERNMKKQKRTGKGTKEEIEKNK